MSNPHITTHDLLAQAPALVAEGMRRGLLRHMTAAEVHQRQRRPACGRDPRWVRGANGYLQEEVAW